jgi:Domain of unknown function (DUF6391)
LTRGGGPLLRGPRPARGPAAHRSRLTAHGSRLIAHGSKDGIVATGQDVQTVLLPVANSTFLRGPLLIARIGRLTQANRVRRNHALEHAAITVITERHPQVFLRGRSNSRGFYIFGSIDSAELKSAVEEALRRLRTGEAALAIHPRCGTNLAVAGILSGTAAALASQLKPRQNRYSYAILAALAALIVSPRVGFEAQRHFTTLADPADLMVERVEKRRFPFTREPVHWVKTRSES